MELTELQFHSVVKEKFGDRVPNFIPTYLHMILKNIQCTCPMCAMDSSTYLWEKFFTYKTEWGLCKIITDHNLWPAMSVTPRQNFKLDIHKAKWKWWMQSFLESVIRGEIFQECLTGLSSSYLELTSACFIYGIMVFYSITHFYLFLKFCGLTSSFNSMWPA